MNQLPILMYHGIEESTRQYPWAEEERPYVVSKDAFEGHLKKIMELGFKTLGLDDIRDFLHGAIEEKSIVLTFDDGHASHSEIVVPLLKKYRMQAIFFVPVNKVGQEGYVEWPHLAKMAEDGFDLGSHGMNHVPLTNLSEKDLYEEIVNSRKILEYHLSARVNSFSVPRGFCHVRLLQAIERHGYEFVFTSHYGVNTPRGRASDLKRICIKRDTSLSEVEQIMQGKIQAQKLMERAKEYVREHVKPETYDWLAAIKRRLTGGGKA
ncbi:MAG: hypothetical protein A3G33_10850 [Omnitrophica bacterium RIFCSPLOWO2_12_FULL_44_17]|uniref:NodB homology domain-containing protein n=1 Tax=Candidatus Danuiimicrobium aquiferis TaxID=1801832 RepID=A0A1G1KRE5_9BACT|nr:MAG: hypothetical protein A3B72_03170 [Omnitrophica bacterium RIFCSPHIGHO2_02_FULL_45_28]OGW88660.1 MAG: hypothetical protein A3E74_05995 [Omnitrophica bacterium RIFCSPHIGHO2_12_FULL_44_12]OGW95467.1 MAG: hypothetical protein A3G33_10850 [Omnitrophica bacterium RIFCSPLOWO2_12_FULL_44_17]OGX03346.1 MAG: hypothetical protein A3J12_07490 [Omnitrophica bacterium RIFCSPLOWO2_02_FULL_44_11]